MSKVSIEIRTRNLWEFRLAAEELGCIGTKLINRERIRTNPRKRYSVYFALKGRSGVGKSTFQRFVAGKMLFNQRIREPKHRPLEWHYSQTATGNDGTQLEAIFKDIKGVATVERELILVNGKPKRIKRSHPGPTFIQHAANPNAFRIGVTITFLPKNEARMHSNIVYNITEKTRFRVRIITITMDRRDIPVRAFLRAMNNHGIEARRLD